MSINRSPLVFILAHGLLDLPIAVSELDPNRFPIDYGDSFDHLANELIIIVREAIEVFLQISRVLCHA